jgi:hypothetical protein
LRKLLDYFGVAFRTVFRGYNHRDNRAVVFKGVCIAFIRLVAFITPDLNGKMHAIQPLTVYTRGISLVTSDTLFTVSGQLVGQDGTRSGERNTRQKK